MKIGIVGFSNFKVMPYLKYYTDIFEKYALDYEVIYWNRRNIDEVWKTETFAFTERLDDSDSKLSKIGPMIRFARYAKFKIKERKYDFLVILTTIPAVLMGNFLSKQYRGKYVVDIRDYTYEEYFVYRRLLKGVLDKAALRVLSSPYFKSFLPQSNFVTCHNLSVPRNGNRQIRSQKPRDKDVINISYIGLISYFTEVVKLLDAIGNDPRFTFSVYGAGADELSLEKYCLGKKISNVYFHGAYQPFEKETFYADTDLVFNAYGNTAILVRFLLSNKLYDAAWYRIPILVTPGTAMSEAAGGLKFELDFNKPNIADELYSWYKNIDWELFERTCDSFIDRVIMENKEFEKQLLISLNVKDRN